MINQTHTHDVGAADPELNTSPILDEFDEENLPSRHEIPGGPGCYFNDFSYPPGTYVKSGSYLLKCDFGTWIPAGPADADNV